MKTKQKTNIKHNKVSRAFLTQKMPILILIILAIASILFMTQMSLKATTEANQIINTELKQLFSSDTYALKIKYSSLENKESDLLDKADIYINRQKKFLLIEITPQLKDIDVAMSIKMLFADNQAFVRLDTQAKDLIANFFEENPDIIPDASFLVTNLEQYANRWFLMPTDDNSILPGQQDEISDCLQKNSINSSTDQFNFFKLIRLTEKQDNLRSYSFNFFNKHNLAGDIFFKCLTPDATKNQTARVTQNLQNIINQINQHILEKTLVINHQTKKLDQISFKLRLDELNSLGKFEITIDKDPPTVEIIVPKNAQSIAEILELDDIDDEDDIDEEDDGLSYNELQQLLEQYQSN